MNDLQWYIMFVFLVEILKAIKEARFELTLMKEMHLTPEHAGKVYFKITGKDFYKNVLEVLSS